MESTVQIQEKQLGEVLVLRIKGRLDAIASPNAEKTIFDHIDNGQSKLLVDFSQVDYLSSAGMRLLLRTAKKLKTSSGKLVVCSVTNNVLDVLKMSGFDHIIEISKNEDEGLHKFR